MVGSITYKIPYIHIKRGQVDLKRCVLCLIFALGGGVNFPTSLASPVLLFGLELIVLKQDFFSLFLIIRCVRVRVCARARACVCAHITRVLQAL